MKSDRYVLELVREEDGRWFARAIGYPGVMGYDTDIVGCGLPNPRAALENMLRSLRINELGEKTDCPHCHCPTIESEVTPPTIDQIIEDLQASWGS